MTERTRVSHRIFVVTYEEEGGGGMTVGKRRGILGDGELSTTTGESEIGGF